jgi:Flp pilus assembly protein TadG
MRGLARRLRGDRSGAMAIEFAILAPAFFMMFIGVFTVSVYLQNYNAVRSVVSDAVRNATVSYQNSNDLNEDEIRAIILGTAVNTPYLLKSDSLDITVTRAATSRVNGAIEFDVQVNYAEADWLPFADLPQLTISYGRPIFVVAS